MPREHPTITLTDHEIAEFLATQSHCIVATLDADGSPWGDLGACAFDDGMLYIQVSARSRSARHLRADPRVCCTLESKGADYYTIKAAMVHGQATPIAPEHPVAQRLGTGLDPLTRERVEGAVFSVGLDHVVSFDFAKIKRRFEQT